MSETPCTGHPLRLPRVAVAIVVTWLAFALSPVAAYAIQSSVQFDVLINVRASATLPQTGQCGTTTAKIVCGQLPGPSGARAAPAGYRFLSYATGVARSVDIYTGAGTSTAFRVVNWADREYIEMTVGW